MNIFETISGIIKDQLAIDESMLLKEETLLDELNADSLDVVEIIMNIEDEFDIEISDPEAESVRTVGDIVRVVSSKIE